MNNDYELYELGKFRSQDLIREAQMVNVAKRIAQIKIETQMSVTGRVLMFITSWTRRSRKPRRRRRTIHPRIHRAN